MIKHLNSDIIYNILQFSDYKTSINFLLTCKFVYGEYLVSLCYYNTLFIKQILKHFYLKSYVYVTLSHQQESLVILNKIYNHFYNHRNSSFIDFIIYIIENVEKYDDNSLPVLSFFIQNCETYCSSKYSKHSINRFNISINDLKYIIVHADLKQLEIILKNFQKPIYAIIITQSIYEILLNSQYKKLVIVNKINLLTDYFFHKFYKNDKFNTIDDLYFHKMINYLIQYDYSTNINYIILKKIEYNLQLDYPSLFDTCIRNNKYNIFKILIKEYHHDTNINNISLLTNLFPFILSDQLEYLCKKGSFVFVADLISNFFKHKINLDINIKAITNGLIFYYDTHIRSSNTTALPHTLLYEYIDTINIDKIESSVAKSESYLKWYLKK